MWKFKASKYKNAAPKIPKKEECILDLSAGNLLASCGNHLAASCAYIAHSTDTGGAVGVVGVNERGRGVNHALVHAHSEFVNDFAFSPFDDYLLATGSQDGTTSLWRLPPVLSGPVSSPLSSLPRGRRVDSLAWHPAADNVLVVNGDAMLTGYDVSTAKEMFAVGDHGDQIQSVSWSGDGATLATSCRDARLRLIDPRAGTVTQTASGHHNHRDSRVAWLGNNNYVLSSGFGSTREREVKLRDVRNFSASLASMQMDTSTGVLMPLFDADTNMLFLAGKGDTAVRYLEVAQKHPHLTLNSVDTMDQIKGASLLPKRAVDVLGCEVDRLLLLTRNSIVPVAYHVPRKSYTEFHSDLFPDTRCGTAAMTADQWMAGDNTQCSLMSLDPARRGEAPQPAAPQTTEDRHIAHDNQPSNETVSNTVSQPVKEPIKEPVSQPVSKPVSEPVSHAGSDLASGDVSTPHKPDIPHTKPSIVRPSPEESSSPVSAAARVIRREKKVHSVFQGVHQSKFRHLSGSTLHRSTHIENLRNVSSTLPGESDMFAANRTFCAVPIAGPGGRLMVLKVSSPGRLPDSGNPVIQNGAALMDFVFDPFDDHRLVTACDDGKLRVWTIPAGGLTETLTQPTATLTGHTEKVYFARFHPLARDVLMTASYDGTVRVWDVGSGEERGSLEGHTDTVLCGAWSPDGRYVATVCRDGRVRVYNPRLGGQPLGEGPGPEGPRGARVVWVCGGKYLLVSGFDAHSTRQLTLHDPADLSADPVTSVALTTGDPSILVPTYDPDSGTIFLTGRGDGVVLTYEVADEAPYLFPLTNYTTQGLHQALAFLPKTEVDVRAVEFARALRLTTTRIEPISFTVPRVKTEYFQDDLFPPTVVTTTAAMTAAEWFAGENRSQLTVSLKPSDMMNLSEAPVEVKTAKYESFSVYQQTHKTDEEKKEELLSAMNRKLDIKDEPLPQDLTEGVEEDEWDD